MQQMGPVGPVHGASCAAEVVRVLRMDCGDWKKTTSFF